MRSWVLGSLPLLLLPGGARPAAGPPVVPGFRSEGAA
jgi:hypothetical protein